MSPAWRRAGGAVTEAPVTAADGAFVDVKGLRRGWQGHFKVPSVQLEDAF